jgi:hypothetical protein
LFPQQGKRGNPNGFNFPVLIQGKRTNFDEDDYEMNLINKRSSDLDIQNDFDDFVGNRGKRFFTAARGKRDASVSVRFKNI